MGISKKSFSCFRFWLWWIYYGRGYFKILWV